MEAKANRDHRQSWLKHPSPQPGQSGNEGFAKKAAAQSQTWVGVLDS